MVLEWVDLTLSSRSAHLRVCTQVQRRCIRTFIDHFCVQYLTARLAHGARQVCTNQCDVLLLERCVHSRDKGQISQKTRMNQPVEVCAYVLGGHMIATWRALFWCAVDIEVSE